MSVRTLSPLVQEVQQLRGRFRETMAIPRPLALPLWLLGAVGAVTPLRLLPQAPVALEVLAVAVQRDTATQAGQVERECLGRAMLVAMVVEVVASKATVAAEAAQGLLGLTMLPAVLAAPVLFHPSQVLQ